MGMARAKMRKLPIDKFYFLVYNIYYNYLIGELL